MRNFLVLIFTCSTAGWSKGFILSNFPKITVSKIKYENNFPIVSSFDFLILNSRNGILFFLKDSIKAFD